MPKQLLRLTLVLVLIAVSTPCRAQDRFPRSRFKLGYNGEHLLYRESIMRNKGILHGAFASWTGYFTDSHLMVGVEGDVLNGGLKYKGHSLSGAPLAFSTENTVLEGRVLVGKGFERGRFGITPYTGLGVRRWYNRLKSTPGYGREVLQYYLPLGVNVVARPADHWSVGGSVEGDMLLRGTVKLGLSDAIPGMEDPCTHLRTGQGSGLRLSAFAERDFGKFALGIEPYCRYWHFSRSDMDAVDYGGTTYSFYEPRNNFTQYGLRVYIAF